jgi:hypothetical protein
MTSSQKGKNRTLLKHFVANERYLKYFVEIILKLKFLIYRTYSDRYRRPLVSGRSLEMTASILWSVRILCWSLALPLIRRVPFVELRNELGNVFGGFWQRFWLLARVCCTARPLLWMWNSTARPPLKLSSLGSVLALLRFRRVDAVPFAALWIEFDNVLDQFWQ